jgi:osmotically-inducible protein OsmY
MKKMLLGFALGVAAGAFALWYYQEDPTPVRETRSAVTGTADRVRSVVNDKISEINTEDIKRELERGGTVVREKMTKAGEAISDATADARTTATIKGKFLKEPGLSSLGISVTTTDGLVTLSGTAGSHEEVAKAMRIALNTDGVRKVVSTLQVKPAQ